MSLPMSPGEDTTVPQETRNDVEALPVAQEAPEATQHALPFGDEEYIVATARGIVTNELMIADLSRHEWQMSLGLMMGALHQATNLGAVLVPFIPHASLKWINGVAPGCTMQCQLVAIEDMDALSAECERMYAALHPEPPTTKDNDDD